MTDDEAIEKLVGMLHKQLDSPEMRQILQSAALIRRMDITLFVDRGSAPKPPRITIV